MPYPVAAIRGGLGQGGGAVALLPFSDDFARADGAIGSSWTGATWTIATNKAVNTPTLGSERLTNGGFDVDANWTKEADWTIGGGVATKAAGAATRLIYQNVVAIGTWYRVVWTLVRNAGTFNAILGSANASVGRTASATYTDSFRANNISGGARGTNAGDGTIDDVSIKALTLSTLFATRECGRNDVDASVKATIVSGNICGLVLNLDSTSSPANFIIAHHDGITARLDKCVGGTYTNLIVTAATYSAGAILEVKKSSTTYQLFYAGTQRGTDQTVSDAGIISNTVHGMFQTYEGNSLDDFSIVAN